MKTVAILQSNYIPWKGYFDIIAAVDEFILYDEVQFTKNDWRNRNRIKTSHGVEWISVPVGQNINRRICDVELPDSNWQEKHWRTLVQNYGKAACFGQVAAFLEPIYRQRRHTHLSGLNRELILAVCRYLGVATSVSSSADYVLHGDRTARLVSLCEQAGALRYISGPSAQDYLDLTAFRERGIELVWFDYSGYPRYPQRWGEFVHAVSILDLLFNCGPSSPDYMLFGKRMRAGAGS